MGYKGYIGATRFYRTILTIRNGVLEGPYPGRNSNTFGFQAFSGKGGMDPYGSPCVISDGRIVFMFLAASPCL